MATFYKGDEVKFAIELTAQGFSMDDDNFDIEVSSPKASVKASKSTPAPENALVIFKDNEEEPATWYAIVATSKLNPGDLRVIATAYVPDTEGPDGVRRQSDIKTLGTLKSK